MQLKSFIYGGIDGIITISTVIASIEGVNLDAKYILSITISVLLTGAMSMGIADYLSSKVGTTQDIAIINGMTTAISFIIFGVMPLLFYTIIHKYGINPFRGMVLTTAVAFFILGGVQSRYSGEIWYKSGAITAAYGTATSLFAYIISSML
jgi:VIT1/CCC1 family predicted Fe2+/Mn2+ transporter